MMNKKKAEEIADYAYKNVPAYIRIAEERGIHPGEIDFLDYPVTDKNMFLDSGTSTLSMEYMGKYGAGKLRWLRTSGSTGKFTEVYWDEKEYQKSLLPLWLYRKKYYGIMPDDKMCYFYASDKETDDFYEKGSVLGITKNFVSEGKMGKAYQMVLDYDPVWMILQPSVAVLLCEVVQQEGLQILPSLRYIEFTGEYLEDSVRQKVESVFSCMTANQYGSKEVNSIAYECPEGNLHCMGTNVYLESMEDNMLCVTTLQNKGMPLVRFRIGDRGELIENVSCKCKNKNPILKLLAGRDNDWIAGRDGKKYHAHCVMHIVHTINYRADGVILQYQIIQKDFDTFLYKLVLEDLDAKEEIEKQVVSEIKNRFGKHAKIEFEFLEHLIPDEKTGKLRCFIKDF